MSEEERGGRLGQLAIDYQFCYGFHLTLFYGNRGTKFWSWIFRTSGSQLGLPFESYFNEAERLDPCNVRLLTERAFSYICLRRFPEALQNLDQVLNITPDEPDTLVQKAAIANENVLDSATGARLE